MRAVHKPLHLNSLCRLFPIPPECAREPVANVELTIDIENISQTRPLNEVVEDAIN